MAFEEVDIIEAVASSNKTGISAGLTKLRTATAKLRLTIRREHFDSLGFTLQDRFVLLLGKEEDHGILRLQKNKSGKIVPKLRLFARGMEAVTINLQHRPEFVDRAEKAGPVQWERIDFTTIEIVLPSWAEETAPGKTRRIAAVPATVAAGQKERDRVLQESREARRIREERERDDERSETERMIAEALKDDGGRPFIIPNLTRSHRTILSVLAKKSGKTVAKDALMTLCYGADADDPPDEKILDVHICKIRPKLPAGVAIETVWGEGYRLAGDVELLYLQPA